MRNKTNYFVVALLFLGWSGVQAASRTFNVRNLCNEPVWLGVSGGSCRNRHSEFDTTCGGDGDCFEGTKCVQTGAIRQCFWENPEPKDGNYRIESGASTTLEIPVHNDDLNIIWSGIMTGRTNCTSEVCEKADCGNGDKGCKPGQGFMQPATQAEMTLLKKGVDFYDVEVINGVHMPVSLGPTNAVVGDSAYKCGTPGALHPSKGLAPCTWDLKPPSNDYNWVTAGGAHCQLDSECSDGTVCGISFNPGHADLFQKTCGKFLGYYTADQICGVIPSYGAPFNCQERFHGPGEGFIAWNYYLCVGVGSCYQPGAAENCCGCANWEEEGIPVPFETEKCKNKNSAWREKVMPTLKWLKEACPSAYTYPYDDISSTFTCDHVVNDLNSVNYQVTFCPQNEKLAAEFLQ